MTWRLGGLSGQDSDDEDDLEQPNDFTKMQKRWTDVAATKIMTSSGWLKPKQKKVKQEDRSEDESEKSQSGSEKDLMNPKVQKPAQNDKMVQKEEIDRDRKYIQGHRLMRRGVSAQNQLISTADALDATPERIVAAGYTMMPHQLEGTGRLRSSENSFLNAALLADDMGCGKTLQLIGLVLSNPLTRPTLFVVPASLASMWVAAMTTKYVDPPLSMLYYHGQIKKTTTSDLFGNYEAVLTTYETLTREWHSCDECIRDFADHAKGKTRRVTENGKGNCEVGLSEVRRSHPLIGMQWGRVVLDEAHRICNESTSIASAVYSLTALKRVASTGTPFQNEYTDLRSIFVFLRIEPWNDRLFFKEHFLLTRKGRKSTKSKATLKGWRNNVLSLGLEGLWVRRLRGERFESHEVTNTVPTVRKIERLSLDDGKYYGYVGQDEQGKFTEQGTQEACRLQWDEKLQAEKEEAKKDGLTLDCDEKPRGQILQEILRARMCCVHHACPGGKYSEFGIEETVNEADDGDSSESVTAGELLDTILRQQKQANASRNIKQTAAVNRQAFREATKHAWHSTKIDRTVEIAKERLENDAGKLVVFCDFLTGLDILENALEENNLPCLRYDGTMTAAAKDSACKAFQSDSQPRVILVTSSSGSEGLDFTAATTIILLNPFWNPAQEAQCIARADRIGQSQTVTVYRLLCRSSIELRIKKVQNQKIRKATRVTEPKRWITPQVRSEMLKWSLDDFKYKMETMWVGARDRSRARSLHGTSNAEDSGASTSDDGVMLLTKKSLLDGITKEDIGV